MSGGTDDHNTIGANILTFLKSALRHAGKFCRVYGSDMKIHTGDQTNTFPDVTVVCGERHYHRSRKDIITNPLLVVEVLSDSTEGYDRGEKFDHYKTVPSLIDYLLVEQFEPRVLLYTRTDDNWTIRDIVGRDRSVFLPSLELTLSLGEIYDSIDFDQSL
jgi:Uma2 family endonuclease